MTQTRVYLPLTPAALARLRTTGSIGAAPVNAFAVTAAVEREHPGAEVEVQEYTAFRDAVRAAGAVRSPGARRIVAAADVDSATVHERAVDDAPASAVELTEPVPQRRVVSVHIDDAPGLTPSEDDELLWFDVTELDEVVRLTR